MKAVFLSYNQALTDRVNAILDEQGIRGFTKWALTEGRGSVDGEPHYGTHAWPSMNASILAIVDDEKVAPLMDAFREMDAATRMQGARALVWNIESGCWGPGGWAAIPNADADPAAGGEPPAHPSGGADVSNAVTIGSPRFSRRPASAPHGPESRFRRFRDIRRPEAVFETYAAMRCEK